LPAWKPHSESFDKAAKASPPWHGHDKPRRFHSATDHYRCGHELKSRIRKLQEECPGGAGDLLCLGDARLPGLK